MTTSLSYDFGQTGTQLIQGVYEDLKVVIPGGTISSARSTIALDRLNKILKQYQGNIYGGAGIPIISRQRVTLLLAKGQQSYLIGPAATDARASTAMGRTTVSSAYASGTSLSVTSLTDTTTYPGTTITMTASDFIGVQLNDGTISYTTINAAVSSPITLNGALAGAAAAGNYVYWFTSRAQRFPVLEAATLRSADYSEMPLEVYNEVKQYDLGVTDKYGDGTPTALLVEPLRLNTRIILNSQPTDVTQQINLTVLYPAEDMDSAANDIAFPQEAYRFLHYELAFALSPIYTWTPQMDKLRNEARAMYLNLNPENSTLYFAPGGL